MANPYWGNLFGSDPTPPAAPDYAGAAVAQGAANKETAIAQAKLNNPNVVSPYGNQNVVWGTPDASGVSQATITQSLTPQAQKTLEAQQALQGNLANLAGTAYTNAFDTLNKPFSFGGPDVQTSLAAPGALQGGPSAGQYGMAQGALDLSGVAKMPVNAGMTAQEAIMARLEPSLARNRVSTETQLINQGLRPGTEAYDNAARLLGQQENDQRTQAALQGINLDMSANQQGYGQALTSGQYGNQAISQNFGQGLSAAQANNAMVAQQANQNLQQGQFANTAQQQAMAQALQQRQLPINEISALTSQSQIQNPQFGAYQGSNIAPAPIANAAGQTAAYNQNLYNQQTASANQNLGGIFGLGSAALGNIPAITKLFGLA